MMNQKTLIFDIETNGLLLDVSEFWIAAVYHVEEDKMRTFRDIHSLLEHFKGCTRLIGHNIVGYDLPAIEKLSGASIEHLYDVAYDTLLASKLIYYDKDSSFSHSLRAWGDRFKFPKGDYSDWSKYSEEMEEYCIRDVEVTTKLYNYLLKKGDWLPYSALELEQKVQRIVTKQYQNGWLLDIKKAKELHVELVGEYETALGVLQETFKQKFLPRGPVKTPKREFTRLGVTTLGPNQPITLTEFNPGSGNHIIWWLEKDYNWSKWTLTDKGNPKTDSDTLLDMFGDRDWAAPLLHYLEVKKLLGQLAEGKNSWLNKVGSDGRIHGSADILGAVTGRFTHSNPNLAQVPSVRAYKGPEARSLFTVPKGYKLVGCDASGLELRTLSHFLSRFDGGTYGNTVLSGDIHTANQHAAGLPTRDDAKTFIYAFLYGAGDAKIGSIVHGSSKKGKELKTSFLSKVEGLDELKKGVEKSAKKGWIKGITGRRLYIRSPHSALNTLLQSAGAYVMKYWAVLLDETLTKEGIDYKFVGNIHDEIQAEVLEEHADRYAKIAEQCFLDVTEQIGFRCKLEGESKIGDNWYDTH